jgi:hypothetical protein
MFTKLMPIAELLALPWAISSAIAHPGHSHGEQRSDKSACLSSMRHVTWPGNLADSEAGICLLNDSRK